jgi:hypothetical protein
MSDPQNAEISPFRPVVPDHEISDLRERLSRARLPEPETAPGWAQGIPLGYLTELIGYWRDKLTPTEKRWLEEYAEFGRSGRGYALQQSTRPQTIGYALADRPARLDHGEVLRVLRLRDQPPRRRCPETASSTTSRCTGSPALAQPRIAALTSAGNPASSS